LTLVSASEHLANGTYQKAGAKNRRYRDEERQLVRRAIDGDTDAFAQLYDLLVVRVYRHVYYMVNETNAAEDLTAQTFLKAWEAMPRYTDRGVPFAAWILRIGHNVAVSYLRSKRDHSELQDIHIDQKRHNNPDEALREAEDQKAVREAIMQLNEDQRQVIVLRFVEELDYAEVAGLVGKSISAVRVIQHRALGNLRKILAASA
jgi:RNA polymerase sigma-70 factor (ECF subfamily)